MPRSDMLLRHNLHEFQRSIVGPIADIPTTTVDTVDIALVDHRTALGVEAAWWAHLGCALEFFSTPETEQLVRKQWVFLVHNFDRFVRRFADRFELQLPTSMPQDLPEFSTTFVDPCCLHSTFQEILVKVSMSNADHALRSFSAAINFTSDTEWKTLISRGIEASSAPRSTTGGTTLSVVGIARALDFMIAVKRSVELTLASQEVEEADAYTFLRYVARIARWRFSVHLPKVRGRFVEVAERMFDMIHNALNTSIRSTEAKSDYLGKLEQMLLDWESWGNTRVEPPVV